MAENSGPEVIVYPADDDPIVLTEAETRVLGALVEKQLTTPDYYPLTLNALVNACNQTTSRDPVVSYDESVATRALDGLRDKKLAYVYAGADSRALKYGHKLVERLELTPDETAALCVLLLRGPQTGGEIRTRTARLHAFASLTEVDATLAALAAKRPRALVTKLPRQPGFKEARFAHLLSGEPRPAAPTAGDDRDPEPPPTSPDARDRITQLEQDLVALREELTALREAFADFRRQFD